LQRQIDSQGGDQYRNSYVLMHQGEDPMFKDWADTTRQTIQRKGITPYDTYFRDFDPKLDRILVVPVNRFEDVEAAQNVAKSVRYVGSFGHGHEGSVYYNSAAPLGCRDGGPQIKQDSFAYTVPGTSVRGSTSTARPISNPADFNFAPDWSAFELYHCKSNEPATKGDPNTAASSLRAAIQRNGYPDAGVYGVDGSVSNDHSPFHPGPRFNRSKDDAAKGPAAPMQNTDGQNLYLGDHPGW
jgi:hypothetical protein